MRSDAALAWSRVSAGSDDLTQVTRSIITRARAIEEASIGLRSVVHELPDRSLDEAVMRLERSACDVTSIVEDLHREVVREFG